MKNLGKLLLRWEPQIKLSPEELEHYLDLFECLPGWRQQALEQVALFGLGLCSKCRWQSGCSKCDPMKHLKYHLRKKKLAPEAKGMQALTEGSAGAQCAGGSDDITFQSLQAILHLLSL